MENVDSQFDSSGSNRKLIISIVLALVVGCCCVVTVVVGYYGYQAYVVAQPYVEFVQDNAINPDPNDLPKGGLADEQTRRIAWISVQGIALISECPNPSAQSTFIKVTQQPDSRGAWEEEWHVECSKQASEIFYIAFTPDSGGFVNVEVTTR